MGMASLQFYKNQYYYPHYSESIVAYGESMPCTPVGMNLRKGTIRVEQDMDYFMSCNYIRITRDGGSFYAWIEDVRYRTDAIFEVDYRVDPWRTYKSKINLDYQFIERRPQYTFLYDDLLGSDSMRMDVSTKGYTIGSDTQRVFVVQVRVGSGEIFSRTPVQPSPYRLYVTPYNVNNWNASAHLEQLLTAITQEAEPQNIVTMYSVPWFDTSSLPTTPLNVITDTTTTINGFKMFDSTVDPSNILYNETQIAFDSDAGDMLRTDHSVQVVIPEAGILEVPTELIGRSGLFLRQDIDIFSGACNYMLFSAMLGYTSHSVRGSSISSIPIVSDPMDTYLSQNQNALATSLIGDVASVAGGVAMAGTGGAIGLALGAGSLGGGINSIVNKGANIADMRKKTVNPPAFLGTALASNFNGKFWVITSKKDITNADDVHANFGYPYNMVGKLTFPSSGFIKTQGCGVFSTDGTVPSWAIQEINQLFDGGIMVH